MTFTDLITSLKNIACPDSAAFDIVDRNGRHHEPKGVPPGGQFESEGQYLTTAKAKEEYFHKKFAGTKEAKEMRDMCAGILSHIDSSKIGNDTAKHYFKETVHQYAGMSKDAVLKGAKQAYADMKKHARIYDSIKNMGKEEFTKWVENNPEYNSTQMQNLLTNKAYNKAYTIKNEKGESVKQDHEAWEEAKTLVARKATQCMVDYLAHVEALNNTPDALIEAFLGGKGSGGKHKAGAEAYEKEHGLKHGEGDYAKNVTLSEINAVESELSKAFEDAKTDESKTAYAHALSHFLGKDGGLRDPSATKESIGKKVMTRVMSKQKALADAKQNGDASLVDAAEKDLDATIKAAELLDKVAGIDGGLKNPGDPVHPDDVTNNELAKAQEEEEEKAAIAEESTAGVPAKKQNAGYDKLKKSIGAFLESDKMKQISHNVDKHVPEIAKTVTDNFCKSKSVDKILEYAKTKKSLASSAKKEGDGDGAKSNMAAYIYALKKAHELMSS